MKYGYTKQIELPFDKAVVKVKEELPKEGFGVLTEINVKDTLKKKINVEFDNYIILGACNPALAHEALLSEREIGLLLPCNVIVYEKDGAVFASGIMPTVAMGMVENEELHTISEVVEEKMKTVINNL
jgi:uncharacterized protein (DUF302 family)